MSRPSLSFPAAAIGITAIAFVLRGLFALCVPVVPAASDPTAYVTFATSLAAGNGFGWGPDALTAFWPPGPSAVYAGLFLLFGIHLWLIAALHVAIGTATVTLTMLVTRRYANDAVALLAGLLMAFWPLLIQYTTIPSSEPLFQFLIVAAAFTWGEGPRQVLLRGVLCGMLLAAASLMRPTGLLLPAVLAAAEILRHRRIVAPALTAAVATIVILVLLAPWAYRNHLVFGRAFLTSSSGSANMWLGNNDATLPPGEMWPPDTQNMSEAERADWYRQEVRRFIRENPLEFLKRCVVRFFRVHERESIGVVWNDRSFEAVGIGPSGQMAIKVGTNLYYGPVLLLSIVGLAYGIRANGLLPTLGHPLVLMWLYFALVHAIVVVQDRYHHPSIPAMAAMAASAVHRLRARPEAPAPGTPAQVT